jgi:hypothetical protein
MDLLALATAALGGTKSTGLAKNPTTDNRQQSPERAAPRGPVCGNVP